MKLRDPEQCPNCHVVKRFRVVASRRRKGYRRRVHRCRECGQKWEVFVTTINPRNVYAV